MRKEEHMIPRVLFALSSLSPSSFGYILDLLKYRNEMKCLTSLIYCFLKSLLLAILGHSGLGVTVTVTIVLI